MFGNDFLGGGFGGMPGAGHGLAADEAFEETYRCFPVSFMGGKEDKEKGDKIILPASAFETLAGMTVTYPMQFELRNEGCPLAKTDTFQFRN